MKDIDNIEPQKIVSSLLLSKRDHSGCMSTRNTSSSCRKLDEKVAKFRIFALNSELGYIWITQVVDHGTERWLLTPDGCCGWRPPDSGRLETGGVPSKPPATILLSVPSVFWDLGSLYQMALRRHLPRAVAAAVFSSTACLALEQLWCSVFVHIPGAQMVVDRRLDESCGGPTNNA